MNEAPWHAIRKSLEVRSKSADARLEKLRPLFEQAQAEGCSSVRQIAAYLNSKGVRTTRGKNWSAAQVGRALARLWPAATDLRAPDLRLGGFSGWVLKPCSRNSYADTKLETLLIKARMEANGAIVEVGGPLAGLSELIEFRSKLADLAADRSASASLDCTNRGLKLALTMEIPDRVCVELFLSADPHTQSHVFHFYVDQSSIQPLLVALDRHVPHSTTM